MIETRVLVNTHHYEKHYTSLPFTTHGACICIFVLMCLERRLELKKRNTSTQLHTIEFTHSSRFLVHGPCLSDLRLGVYVRVEIIIAVKL